MVSFGFDDLVHELANFAVSENYRAMSRIPPGLFKTRKAALKEMSRSMYNMGIYKGQLTFNCLRDKWHLVPVYVGSCPSDFSAIEIDYAFFRDEVPQHIRSIFARINLSINGVDEAARMASDMQHLQSHIDIGNAIIIQTRFQHDSYSGVIWDNFYCKEIKSVKPKVGVVFS